MATKRAVYKEPSSYFNDSMKKAAEKWDKENAGKGKAATKKAPAKKAADKKK